MASGPTHRSGSALSPSVPESLFPWGVPIAPGVEASCRVQPQMQTLRPGFSKHESEILWGPLPSIGKWPTHYSQLREPSDAGGRIPGTEPAVRPDGPTAVLAGFRPFRRIGHPAVVTRHLLFQSHFYILHPAGGKP